MKMKYAVISVYIAVIITVIWAIFKNYYSNFHILAIS